MVRVDFFKPSGKWCYTEAVKWTGDYNGLIHKAFEQSLRDHLGPIHPTGNTRLAGLRAVCLEPYHEHSHPICCDIPERGMIPE
jgi:hypothetical protein